MSPTGKFQFPQQEDEPRRPAGGRIEFDERGNAIWVPQQGGGSKEAMQRLLRDDTLAIVQDDRPGTLRQAQPNPGGLRQGYDPYDSGMLVKKQWKKKKDLRALSKWIEQKKKLEPRDD